jgi:molybdopterin/thiamine biosynthesis adenylyltransferase/rhodanese-related sulfurtransferase
VSPERKFGCAIALRTNPERKRKSFFFRSAIFSDYCRSLKLLHPRRKVAGVDEAALVYVSELRGLTARVELRHILCMHRYARQMMLPEVGEAGQRALAAARVLIVGAGGLGSPVALYLAAAGVGRIGIVDDDVVELSNLQRQILHSTPKVGQPKVLSASERLQELNPDIRIDLHPIRIAADSAMALISEYDLVIDGSDNFPTRYVVNDACVLAGKPYVYGSVSRFEGQVSVFGFRGAGCYRCLYPEPPATGVAPSCAEAGVLGVLPGIIGTLQATEALKIILGIGDPLVNRLLLFDALAMKFRELKLHRDPACPVCGKHPTIKSLGDVQYVCASAIAEPVMVEITPTELNKRLAGGDDIMLVDVREPHELAICSLPGSWPIPLAQIKTRANEIDAKRDVVVYCRSGGRSAKAIADLREAGYAGKLINLKGGMLAWSDEVDPNVPKY